MAGEIPLQRTQKFLRYQSWWAAALMVGWFGINVAILASSKLMEYAHGGHFIALWEPFCWEISSNLIVLLLIPVGLFVSDRWVDRFGIKSRIALHMLATIPFSIVHVVSMVAIRHVWYRIMDSHYQFGDPVTEFFYEYRKDVQT